MSLLLHITLPPPFYFAPVLSQIIIIRVYCTDQYLLRMNFSRNQIWVTFHVSKSRDDDHGMVRESRNEFSGRRNLEPGDEPEAISTHPYPTMDF